MWHIPEDLQPRPWPGQRSELKEQMSEVNEWMKQVLGTWHYSWLWRSPKLKAGRVPAPWHLHSFRSRI